MAVASLLMTSWMSWSCGPPYARTCSSMAMALPIPTRASFSASASAMSLTRVASASPMSLTFASASPRSASQLSTRSASASAGERLDALGVLRGALQFGAAGVLLDLDVDLGLREHRLLLGDGHGLLELALLVGRDPLLLERLELLDGDLPVAQLREDLLDRVVARRRVRRADEHLLELEVVVLELLLHLRARARPGSRCAAGAAR